MEKFEWYSSESKNEMYDFEKVEKMSTIESPDYGGLVVCVFPKSDDEAVKTAMETVKNWIKENLDTYKFEQKENVISWTGDHDVREDFISNLNEFEGMKVPFSVYAGAFDDEFNFAYFFARRGEEAGFTQVEYINYNDMFDDDEEYEEETGDFYRDEYGHLPKKDFSKDSWGNYVQVLYDSVIAYKVINPETGKKITFNYIDKWVKWDTQEVRIHRTFFMYTEMDSYLGGAGYVTPVDKDGKYITYYKDFAGFKQNGVIYVCPEDVIEVPGDEMVDILKPEAVDKYKALWEEEMKKIK